MCFDGYCIVAMADGSQKLVKNIIKGDKVLGGTIECVVRTKSDDGKMEYCKTPSGMLVTNCHPIKMDDKWIHPISLYKPALYESEYMYSFLLEKEKSLVKKIENFSSLYNKDDYETMLIRPKSMVINNTEVITLAHNIKNDSVGSHKFLGTEKIVEKLMKCKGFNNGFVTFQAGPDLFIKDRTNYVCDININCEILI